MGAARKDDGRSEWLGPLGALVAFSVAALFAFLVVPAAARAPMDELYGSPAYRTWQMLVLLQAVLWLFAVAYAARARRATRGLAPGGVAAFAAPLWLIVLVALPFLLLPGKDYDWSECTVMPRFYLATAAGLGASAFVGAGMLRVAAIGRAWLRESSPTDSAAAGAELLHALNAQLQRHLVALAAILAAAVIGTEAGRQAILQIEERESMPREVVWQWGLYWSVLLGALYGGIRATLYRFGLRVRSGLLAEVDADESWEDRQRREREIEQALDLDRPLASEIRSLVGVVGPLGGAIASMLL